MIRIFCLVLSLLGINSSFANAENLPRTFMGIYQVSDVVENDQFHHGTLCKSYVDENGTTQSPDFRCGQKLWVLENEASEQIAMFLAPESDQDENLYNFSVFRAALFSQNRKCKTSLPMNKLSGLFQSEVCRGFRVSQAGSLNSNQSDNFMYFPNMEPKSGQEDTATSDAIARAIVTGMLTGLPIGMASVYFIEVPKKEMKSSEIFINELTTGIVFGAKAIFNSRLTLSPLR